jgi:hypothetical protein
MINLLNDILIKNVTMENVAETGVFCVKDKKSAGYKTKAEWFKNNFNHGLKIKIAIDKQEKQIGFIEYIHSEFAWRPIQASNYLFIQCIAVMVKDARNQNIGSALIKQCEHDAIANNKSGVCAMSSDGVWIAKKTLYEKNDYINAEKFGRFELMVKKFDDDNPIPKFIDWTKNLSNYQGWNLIYSDQCPWHEKSVKDLVQCASEKGINLNVIKLITPEEAQNAPSGFGTFSLIKDGKLLEDHYISRTRFENILRKELNYVNNKL